MYCNFEMKTIQIKVGPLFKCPTFIWKPKKRAFSTLELAIGMATIAFILVVVTTGVFILQRSSRDSMRKDKLAEISDIIENYHRQTLSYPESSEISFSGNQVLLLNNVVANIPGPLQAGTSTNSSQTRYFYDRVFNGYVLCVQLESGSIHGIGTSECPDISMW
jgi:hypothetical protein